MMDLANLREEIDRIDGELLQLFLRRMRLCEQVAQHKKEHGLPILNRAREREILAKVQEQSGELEPYAYYLFHDLIELSKARQGELFRGPSRIRRQIERALMGGEEVFPRAGTVACQGVEGSHSQAACEKLLPRGNVMFVKTFEAVFDAVESGLCRFGVLPIENSANGSVRAVYELLQKRRFGIVRATNLFVRHELLANPGAELSGIRQIYSHEQALGQCSRFLASLGSGVTVTPCANTAVAAQMVAESGRDDCAAIAARQCAALYGLISLSDDIQDSDNNYTRFICIAKDPAIYAGANRISLILPCEDKPGALYGLLSKVAVRGINMSKLESCPVTGRHFEYMFFVELEASVKEQGVLSMLEELESASENCIFLGNYAVV